MTLEELLKETHPMQIHAVVKGFHAGIETREKQVIELRQQVTLLRDAILAVCCDPDGVVCIRGSDGDRNVLQDALAATEPNQ